LKVGFLITARMKSTRLPLKLTKRILNREIIAWLIERLKLSEVLDEIVIATSTNTQDQILCDIAKREGIKCFKGSEVDVLDRLYNAAVKYDIEYILNVTADVPLVAYDFFNRVLETYRKTNADLITCDKLPHGFFFYGIKITALKKVLEIKDNADTEIWGPYFKNTGFFKHIDIEIPREYQRDNYRLTLDYQEDYEFLKALFEGMGPETYKKSTIEIIEFLDNHPEIVKINEHCEEMYKIRLESQTNVKLK